MNKQNIIKLNELQLQQLKLINCTYSKHREEIYINDFNENRIFQINLYNSENFESEKLLYICNDDVIINNVFYYNDDVIIDYLYNNYFHTALTNISFKTFDIIGYNDGYYDNELYCVYFDYTYQLIFSSSEDSALEKVSELLIESGYDDCTENNVLYNAVLKVESEV